jgi:hypothetical protein
LREASAAKDQAEGARDETLKTVEHLRGNIKLVLEMRYLTPSLLLEKYDRAREQSVRQKLEEFAVPDPNERKKWLESLK